MLIDRLTNSELVRGFLRDRKGGALVYVVLALPVLLGASGLSVDIAIWHAHKRAAQAAADSAASAGALELRRNEANPDYEAAAVLDAATNGFSTGNGDSVDVNSPPTTGLFTGNTSAVEVVVARDVPTLLASLVFDAPAAVTARAVAMADVGQTCVWALNGSAASAVKVSGTATVNLACGILSNSNAPNAMVQQGSSCLTASSLFVVGGYSSGGCMNPTPGTMSGPLADPMLTMNPPSYDPTVCGGGGGGGNGNNGNGNNGNGNNGNGNNGNGNTTTYIDPGVHCGLQITGNVVLNPGLHVIDGGGLSITAQSVVTGDGVTIYLTENNVGQSDKINIAGGADVTLTAPTSANLVGDAMEGVLFYQDRASGAQTHQFVGGADMQLNGIMYFPNQELQFSGGSSTNRSAAMIVVDTLDITGNTYFSDLTNSVVASNNFVTRPKLVE